MATRPYLRPRGGSTYLCSFPHQQHHAIHTSPPLSKNSISIVHPVHHRIRYKKNQLQPAYKDILNTPKWDPRSHLFKPQYTQQSRVEEHYNTTVVPDLLLANFVHNEAVIPGRKRQEWDGSSPYHINRPRRSPAGSAVETPDIKPRMFNNVPGLNAIWVHTFVRDAVKVNQERTLPTMVLMQQITGKKPRPVYSKSTVMSWRLRKNMMVGAKVKIEGPDMYQFFATLVEIVLPRIKDFKGIENTSGDMFGNISFGLEPADVKLFPEVEGNPELWPNIAGLHITLVTSAQTDPEARTMLSALGLPFVGKERLHNVPSFEALEAIDRKKGIVYSY
ncbi:ribosomal protein L5 domain-containing protein [Lipomyces tetrasporus]|uniref:Ribosomal protein L5 domain-containing protein n=1 Tax=Lipomyces tetrasporus TaxID=54092 RepID=A0AAD7VT52_9ASCO|nr:ribosomal protein L5 domain-containing protein [Lipomyces tetrasporus]KAJ8099775.1 ribosomal protein L5 domain-containing protein [Lipomyces tetrasporus]